MSYSKSIRLASENIELVHSGTDYFTRLKKIINEAKTEIHLQFYIFENDTIGNEIIKALLAAASRDVSIYVLIDGFGSFSFPKQLVKDFRNNGIHFRFFSPLFSANSFYMGRRLHHKVVVADSHVVLVGGINIADKYVGNLNKEPWLDYAVLITDLKIARNLQSLCLNLFLKKKLLFPKKTKALFHKQFTAIINIIQNDWLKRKNEIYVAYLDSFGNAKKEIIIVGSYFLPGRRLYNVLKKASKNQVKIKLLLSGLSDVALSKRATYHIYTSLLDEGIELYEWNKSILHGKAAVVDGYWSTIGSFNLNNLSVYGSIEMNVEIKSVKFSLEYAAHLNKVLAQCQRITPESLQKRNSIFSYFLNWISYWTARLILNIITYFPHNRYTRFY